MFQVSFDAAGVAAVCGGIASIIGACATLVWAFRRDPKAGIGDSSQIRRLPPVE